MREPAIELIVSADLQLYALRGGGDVHPAVDHLARVTLEPGL